MLKCNKKNLAGFLTFFGGEHLVGKFTGHGIPICVIQRSAFWKTKSIDESRLPETRKQIPTFLEVDIRNYPSLDVDFWYLTIPEVICLMSALFRKWTSKNKVN